MARLHAILLLALVAVCVSDQSNSLFFKKMYAELGSNTAERVATLLNDEFAVLNAEDDGRLVDFLYDMLEIRRADLLTSLKHIENLGMTIDMLVEFNSLHEG